MPFFTTMREGYIKLWRKLLEWEWFQEPNMVHLWIYLLLAANYKKSKWQGEDIEIGQLITGLKSLNVHTGISIQSLRTCLERLKSTGEITIRPTNKYSIVTIVKYDYYAGIVKKSTSQSTGKITGKQQSINNPSTTSEEEEEYKEEEEVIPAAPTNLREELLLLRGGKYTDEMLADFLRYWGEKDQKGKARWQKEKTWETALRLVTWEKRSHKNNNEPAQASKPLIPFTE
jgi:hypothetical protein